MGRSPPQLPSPHQPRRRRECLGELVPIDGSEHRWFEDRGKMCSLLAFVRHNAKDAIGGDRVTPFGRCCRS